MVHGFFRIYTKRESFLNTSAGTCHNMLAEYFNNFIFGHATKSLSRVGLCREPFEGQYASPLVNMYQERVLSTAVLMWLIAGISCQEGMCCFIGFLTAQPCLIMKSVSKTLCFTCFQTQ